MLDMNEMAEGMYNFNKAFITNLFINIHTQSMKIKINSTKLYNLFGNSDQFN